MALEQSLAQFAEKEVTEAFSLQNSKLLKVELSGATIQAKLGSMVAHQGQVTFEHAGSGGMARFMKKAVTGEGTDLMKVSGTGEVFLADLAQDVQILKLENEAITANGANVLAFEDGIDWDIKKVEGASSMLGGGLFNMHLSGTGYVAIISDGPPMLIRIEGEQTYADPQAAITWSAGVTTSVKADVNMKTLIGRGSGETMQIAFGGQGWALIQPSEGQVSGIGAGGSGGAAGGIGKLLSG
jgi:uncharacterized protein (AIM24 family)